MKLLMLYLWFDETEIRPAAGRCTYQKGDWRSHWCNPLTHHREDSQLLYLTHWAEMKCFVIIHLITETHLGLRSQGGSDDSAHPLSPSEHIRVSLSWQQLGHPAKRQQGSERRGGENKWMEGVRMSGNCREGELRAVCFLCCGSRFALVHHWRKRHKASLALSQDMHCTINLRCTDQEGGDDQGMDGFERGGPERRAACRVCSPCSLHGLSGIVQTLGSHERSSKEFYTIPQPQEFLHLRKSFFILGFFVLIVCCELWNIRADIFLLWLTTHGDVFHFQPLHFKN